MLPTSGTSSLVIRLFGPFEVQVNGQPLGRLRFRKSESVLALLALRRGAPVERRWLSGLLWPESLDGQMLRNCLTDLRRALGPEAGRLRCPTPGTLALDLARATVDVLAFDGATTRGDLASLAEAVALRRGPLLEGCTEEWAFQEQQRREPVFLAALEKLAALALEEGRRAEAEQHLRRAVATDPLRESAQRALMRLLATSGNGAAALLVYRELRLRLHRELNTEPDPETRALFQQLRVAALQRSGVRGQGAGARTAEGRSEGSETTPNGSDLSPDPSPLSGRAVGDGSFRAPARARNRDSFEHEQEQEHHRLIPHTRLAPGAERLPPNRPLFLTRGRMVGREAEWAELQHCLEDARRGAGSTLLLAGEAGIGKTRLATEAANSARRSGFRVLGGQCDEAGGPPYQPWVEAVREYLETAEAARVEQALPPPVIAALARIIPETADRVKRMAPLPPLPAAPARHAVTEGVRQFFASTATQDVPVLLSLDDLHWADEGSLALLRALARSAPRLPLLILGTYRDPEPDRQPRLEETLAALHRERLSRRLSLRRLSEAAVAEMVTALLGEGAEGVLRGANSVSDKDRPDFGPAGYGMCTPQYASHPATLVAALHQQTEGNPFFVEEMLQHLVEEGALCREHGRWQIRISEALGVPQSVQMTIERRLRRLSQESRETLTLAAVMGQQFTFDLLLQASGMEEERLLAITEAWLAAHLVVEPRDRAGTAGERHRFQHALIREVAYAAASRRRKARLHARVAQALEAVCANDREEHLEELAHHVAQAYRGRAAAGPAVEKGVDYCLRAGEKAQNLSANGAAIQHLTAALDLLDGLPADEPHLRKRWDIVFHLFKACLACSAFERAEAVLQEYLAVSERAGYPWGIAAAHRWIARALARSHEVSGCFDTEGSFQRRMEHLEKSLQVAELHGLTEWRARARWAIANCLPVFRNDLPRAEALLRATLHDPEGLPAEEVRATCGKLLEICALQGKGEAMAGVIRQSLPFGGPSELFFALGTMEEALNRAGKQGEFIAFCEEARSLLAQAGLDPLDAWHLQPAAPSELFRPLLFRDDFDAPKLRPEWQWHDPHPTAVGALASDFRLSEKPGCLTLRAGPGDDLHQENLNAPRMLREVRGDFALETKMEGDWDEYTSKNAQSGLLVWKDVRNFVRLEKDSMFAGHGGSIRLEATLDGEYRIVGRGLLRGNTYCLRLERIGDRLRALCSTDGERWFACGQVEFPLQDPLLAGVAALYGMVVHFDYVQVFGRGNLPPG